MLASRTILFYFLVISGTRAAAQQPQLVLPIGHTSSIRAISFSPDGKRIVTASNDKTAKIWDRASGSLLANLKQHSELILSASFSRDNKYILTASFDSTAIIWDAVTGELVQRLKCSTGRLRFASFSPDGKYVAGIGEDFTRQTKEGISMVYGNEAIEIWEPTGGKPVHRLDSVWGHVASLQFSPDSKYLLTVFSMNEDFGNVRYNRILLWDIASGKIIHEWKGDFADLSPDGKQIITATKKGELLMQETFTPKILYKITDTAEKISQVKFSPDGKYIYSNSSQAICIRKSDSGGIIHRIDNGPGEIEKVSFSPDGRNFVTSLSRGAIIRETVTGKATDTVEGLDLFFNDHSFSPDSRYIAFSGFENNVLIWDRQTHGIAVVLKGHTVPVKWGSYSSDGKYFLSVVQENSLIDYSMPVWDLNKGKLLYRVKESSNEILLARFSPGGREIVTAGKNDTLLFRDAASGKLLRQGTAPFWASFSADISPDGRRFLITDLDGKAILGNVGSRRPAAILSSSSERSRIHKAFFSPDGKKIVTAADDDQIIVWDAVTKRKLYKITGHKIPQKDIAAGRSTSIFSTQTVPVSFSNDGKYMVTVSPFGPVKKWETATGRFINELNKEPGDYYRARLSPDNKKMVTTSYGPEVKIWNALTGNILQVLKGHALTVNSAVFDPGGKSIITASEDNTAKAWDAKTGELKYTFFTVDSSGYFIYTPSQYYLGSADATKLLHYVTRDLKVITFEQLDVKYNRPDKVLEAMGNTDTALIKSYRKAWEKRIKKLGIDTTAFRDGYSVPEADFVNRDNVEYEQKTRTLALQVKGNDSSYKLDRFNVWVNEAPVFGQRGISIRGNNSNSIDTTIMIKLSQGENRIETSISNVNGTESYRMPLIVNYSPAIRQKETLRFIGIGIDQFADPKNNLQYSSKDIRDLAVKLKEKYKDNIIIDTLFNENVTISNVKALKTKLQQTTENDKVIISYSGHGLLSKEYDYFLSTYSIDFNKPEENGLPYEELENLLDSIPARKKLMLIDACHSGEVDKEEITQYRAAAASLAKHGTKGGKLRYTGNSQVGMKNSFELMQSLFVNVGKSTGATIISAAAGTQFALERGDLRNGVFTYSILEAMDKNPTMRISELKKIVGERVEQLTNGLQKPTSRNETIASDWSLW